MKIMLEAIDKADWDRLEKGLPMRPKKKVVMPEPDPPEVPDQIFLEDVLKEKFKTLAGARKRVVRNAEGVMFMGFDVSIDLEDGKRMDGWMSEADIRKLIRLFKNQIDSRIKEVI